MKHILTFLFLAQLAFPQTLRYSATSGDVVLAAAGYKLTIQQPASNAKQVQLEAVQVYCSVACAVTHSQNGAGATATAGTASSIAPMGAAASATIWTDSNVGAGVASGGITHIPAGQTAVFDLTKVVLRASGAANNYTIAIASITGTANITFLWSEQ